MLRKMSFITILVFILAACKKEAAIKYEDLPAQGEASRGETLFTQSVDGAPPCSSCHTLDDNKLQGPGFDNFGEVASERVDGEDAREYTFNSIVSPSKHIVTGYSNVMYKEYAEKLTPQNIADLIAYLLAQ